MKKVLALELVILVSLVLGSIWTEGEISEYLHIAWLLWSVLTVRPSISFGNLQNFKSGWLMFGVALAACIALLIAGALCGTMRDWGRLNAFHYFPLAVLQQFIALIYIAPRLEILFGERGVIVLGTVIFGAIHLPNIPLTLFTLAGGAWFFWVFTKYRNFYVNAFSHFILGSSLSWAFATKLGHMTIGKQYMAFYLNP